MKAARFLVSVTFASATIAQNPAAATARHWRESHERAIPSELTELLAIPNVSNDEANIRRNAEAVGVHWNGAELRPGCWKHRVRHR